MNLRDTLLEAYLDWKNNYLTVEVFAEHHGLTVGQAHTLILLGRDVLCTDYQEE